MSTEIRYEAYRDPELSWLDENEEPLGPPRVRQVGAPYVAGLSDDGLPFIRVPGTTYWWEGSAPPIRTLAERKAGIPGRRPGRWSPGWRTDGDVREMLPGFLVELWAAFDRSWSGWRSWVPELAAYPATSRGSSAAAPQ